MSDTPEVFHSDGFGRKFGPLPIWGWALVLVAGVFVYTRFFHSSAASSSGGSTAATGVPNVMTTGGYLPASQGSGSVTLGATPSMYTDNTSWENAAVQGASSYGSDPLSVQRALDQYMNGSAGTITTAQESLINRIISAIGAPPIPSTNGGTPSVSSGTPRSLVGFVHDPSGTISALFSDNSVSSYSSYGAFETAAKSAGVSPSSYTQVTANQMSGYTKLANNYQPGWSAPNA